MWLYTKIKSSFWPKSKTESEINELKDKLKSYRTDLVDLNKSFNDILKTIETHNQVSTGTKIIIDKPAFLDDLNLIINRLEQYLSDSINISDTTKTQISAEIIRSGTISIIITIFATIIPVAFSGPISSSLSKLISSISTRISANKAIIVDSSLSAADNSTIESLQYIAVSDSISSLISSRIAGKSVSLDDMLSLIKKIPSNCSEQKDLYLAFYYYFRKAYSQADAKIRTVVSPTFSKDRAVLMSLLQYTRVDTISSSKTIILPDSLYNRMQTTIDKSVKQKLKILIFDGTKDGTLTTANQIRSQLIDSGYAFTKVLKFDYRKYNPQVRKYILSEIWAQDTSLTAQRMKADFLKSYPNYNDGNTAPFYKLTSNMIIQEYKPDLYILVGRSF